jgi:hypothetical protein
MPRNSIRRFDDEKDEDSDCCIAGQEGVEYESSENEEADWCKSEEEDAQEEICSENHLRVFPKCQNGSLLDSQPILDPESVYKQQEHNDDNVRTVLGTFRYSDTVAEETLIKNKLEILRIFQVSSFGLHIIQQDYSEFIGRIGFV